MRFPFLVVILASGCVVDGTIADEALDAPDTIGVQSNGPELNGVRLNGVRLNGVRLNGVRLNGVRLNGTTLNGVRLNGSMLTGSDGTTTLTGTMMIGAELVGALSDGTTVSLRIDDAKKLARPNDDVWSYAVSFADSGSWYPICGLDSKKKPIFALAVAGLWNYDAGVPGGGSHIDDSTSFTLACRGMGAIAKCVEMGYKPWAEVNGVALADYHQACTRMVRADYCGDGTPNTHDGVPINVYDGLGIQLDTESWPVNAEWVPAGARCIADTALIFFQDYSASRPTKGISCLSPTSTCGDRSHFLSGTLLIDEADGSTSVY